LELYRWKIIIKKKSGNDGTTLKLSGKFDIIHLYLRGGSIIPYQDTSTYVKNTYELRQRPLEIIISMIQLIIKQVEHLFLIMMV
jgi:alpha-glucosidase (family GH31 glycosyl hydrolase)